MSQQGTDYKFTGKEFDEDTGFNFYYFDARYYEPRIGRWFSVDPAGQGYLPYAFCGNNPLVNVDRNGQFFWSLLVYSLVGGSLGGMFAEAQGENFWGGFFVGAVAGATIWSGAVLSASQTMSGWSGLMGKMISSGGYSMLQDLGHGRGLFESYSFTFGPLTMSLAKGAKSRFGFSMAGALAMTSNWAKGFKLEPMTSLKSGGPVFVGDVENAWGRSGITFGNVIAVQSAEKSVELPEPYVEAGLVPEGSEQWVLGHERVHAIQFSWLSQAFGGINPPLDVANRFYFNFGYDVGWTISYGLLSPFGYHWNPYEFNAYLGHTRY